MLSALLLKFAEWLAVKTEHSIAVWIAEYLRKRAEQKAEATNQKNLDAALKQGDNNAIANSTQRTCRRTRQNKRKYCFGNFISKKPRVRCRN